jgi:hypothetical protein
MIQGTHYLEQGGDAAGEADLGWGASFAQERAAGRFSVDELPLHIAWKELRAILHGLQLWQASYAGRRVVVWTDNTAACVAVNTGRVRTKNVQDAQQARAMVREIATICTTQGIDLWARHIAGKLNVTNDLLSRRQAKQASADYKLMPALFEAHCRWAEVDLYASVNGSNTQALVDKGRGTLWGSVATPAATLAAELPGRRIWANPPFERAGEALALVEQAWETDPFSTSACVCVPDWESQGWHQKWVQRKSSPFRVVHRIPANTEAFLATGARNVLTRGDAPKPAGPLAWPVLVLAIGSLKEGKQ